MCYKPLWRRPFYPFNFSFYNFFVSIILVSNQVIFKYWHEKRVSVYSLLDSLLQYLFLFCYIRTLLSWSCVGLFLPEIFLIRTENKNNVLQIFSSQIRFILSRIRSRRGQAQGHGQGKFQAREPGKGRSQVLFQGEAQGFNTMRRSNHL